jgi:hypothetical protein
VTTNCDLEEMKHIAQQKFIELVDSGVEWKLDYTFGFGEEYRNGHYRAYPKGFVTLCGEDIWNKREPDWREVKKNKDGTYNKQDYARAEKEYAKALEEYKALPMVKAINTLKERRMAAERERQCLKMQKALESSCKALQEALKDTATTLAPEVQTGNTEPYTKPEGHPGAGARKWWQFWRGL